ncbi:hypothetical protein SAMD00019534_101110 [Acytostelium subglobosum LB1]|uniref:hypothetical protein n=1 Tax=Acytostelium subglobosum LB1 TaxID=1410327 RepID=UPI000644D7EE|nr:hypothetical protein SAMD00019534_101110 [Acytostelium subglobosum LB1]GAM26936.1 hypothetical protein SAMD00019534_101110 [Acytostelium subglobosum LB1]|eukprot:XP_012750204.1 hypothetical protein SAMD00019534_101110 [Acytostelium subglobosum LB1]
MVKAGVPNKVGSKNITPQILCQFINNCSFEKPTQVDRALKFAAGYSVDVMKAIKTRLGPFFNHHDCLIKAIKKGCIETVTMIELDDFERVEKNSIREQVCRYISMSNRSTSLEFVAFILDQLACVKRDTGIIEWAVLNDRLEVFELVFNMFTDEMLSDTVLSGIIDQALMNEKPHIIQILQQRFKRGDKSRPCLELRPTLKTLHSVAQSKAYRSLEYYFNSSTFTNMGNISLVGGFKRDRVRSAHSLNIVANMVESSILI